MAVSLWILCLAGETAIIVFYSFGSFVPNQVCVRSLLHLFYKEVSNLSEQVVASVATIDAVVAVGVDVHAEILVSLDQSLRVFISVLWMHVVVGKAMTDKEAAAETCRSLDRVGVVTSRVLLRSTHIALCVYGVVETPVCWR